MTSGQDDGHRRAELVTALGAVRARIADACASVGRDPHDVTLIAVTKTFPASDVALLARLGVGDIGENRAQEAAAKVGETAQLLDGAAAPRWHFLGRLQSRKVRTVASFASVVHSVDRAAVVASLADAVAEQDRAPLDVFVQVSMDGDPARGGVALEAVGELAGAVADRPELVLRGLMTVPPLDADPDDEFARLADAARELRRHFPQADALSAGMSHDFEAALRHGATHVRVGTALLGRRERIFS